MAGLGYEVEVQVRRIEASGKRTKLGSLRTVVHELTQAKLLFAAERIIKHIKIKGLNNAE